MLDCQGLRSRRPGPAVNGSVRGRRSPAPPPTASPARPRAASRRLSGAGVEGAAGDATGTWHTGRRRGRRTRSPRIEGSGRTPPAWMFLARAPGGPRPGSCSWMTSENAPWEHQADHGVLKGASAPDKNVLKACPRARPGQRVSDLDGAPAFSPTLTGRRGPAAARADPRSQPDRQPEHTGGAGGLRRGGRVLQSGRRQADRPPVRGDRPSQPRGMERALSARR